MLTQTKGFLLFLALLLCACSVPANFSMYPARLHGNQQLDNDRAVILVGIAGSGQVNYLQIGHSSVPPMNVKLENDPQGNTIVAIPAPVGLKRVSLGVYTIAGRRAGYTPFGSSFGYIDVHSPGIDLISPGLYYLATIYPASPGKWDTHPPTHLLSRFKEQYPNLSGLSPINFQMP